jgi:hypothetical protein
MRFGRPFRAISLGMSIPGLKPWAVFYAPFGRLEHTREKVQTTGAGVPARTKPRFANVAFLGNPTGGTVPGRSPVPSDFFPIGPQRFVGEEARHTLWRGRPRPRSGEWPISPLSDQTGEDARFTLWPPCFGDTRGQLQKLRVARRAKFIYQFQSL